MVQVKVKIKIEVKVKVVMVKVVTVKVVMVQVKVVACLKGADSSRSLGSQLAGGLALINPAVGCNYFPPGPRLSS